jgi:Lon protease-like protein
VTRKLPLFPLPGVVLLPGTLLPLHIFEPRYREMVANALAGDRTIGMAMLKGGIEVDEGDSPIFPVGGAGEIVDSEELPDGRFNILLEGRFRFRVLAESPASPYRVAEVETIASVPFATPEESARVADLAKTLYAAISSEIELSPLGDEDADSEKLASEIAIRLRYRPDELQDLLETDSLPSRYASLIARMLEWQKRIQFLGPFRPGEIDGRRN